MSEIDDHEAAPRRSLAPGQFVVERQPLEPAVAWQRQGDDRVATHESQPARQARAEGDVLATSGLWIDPAQIAGTGIVQPHRAAMHTGRMRYGKPFRDHAIAGHIDQHAPSARRSRQPSTMSVVEKAVT